MLSELCVGACQEALTRLCDQRLGEMMHVGGRSEHCGRDNEGRVAGEGISGRTGDIALWTLRLVAKIGWRMLNA